MERLLSWAVFDTGSVLVLGAAVAAVVVRLLLWAIERGYVSDGSAEDEGGGRPQRRPRKSCSHYGAEGGEADGE